MRIATGTIDAEADIERSIELSDKQQALLAHADNLLLRITVTAEVGSTAAFTVDKLQVSRDDTSWVDEQDLTDTIVGAAGEFRVPVTAPILDAKYIKLLIKSVTLTGSVYFTGCNIDLIAQVKNKYGIG